MNKKNTNLSLRPDVKKMGLELLKSKKLRSLSELFEALIREEVSRRKSTSFEKQLSEIRAEITGLKKTTANYGKKMKPK